MTHDEIRDLILKEKLIVIFRRVPVDKIGRLAETLVDAGIKFLEVTFDQQAKTPKKDYAECIRAIRDAVGEKLLLGAGTVLTADQVQAAYDNGAMYIISPNTNVDVIKKTRELNLVSIPGAMTPSEICFAWEHGADIVKLFPADDLGYHYIMNLRGPLPHIPLLATGGVNPTTIPEFLKCGINGVGTGASIVNRTMLNNNDYEGIKQIAIAHVKALQSVDIP